jgi:hypothetical protein
MEGIVKILQQPTPPDEVHYLPKNVNKEEKTALAVPYIDARFIHQRLDDACGPFGWQSDVKDIRGFVCVGIGILNPDNGTWVWRWDTGQEAQTEAAEEGEEGEDVGGAKAIVSRGAKRAGVQFGIGRDVYDIPKVRCNIRINSKGGAGGWDEDVAAAIAAKRRSPRSPASAPRPGIAEGWNDPVATSRHEPTITPPSDGTVPLPAGLPGPADPLPDPNGGSKRLIASNAFGDHAQKVGAHREQIAKAIAECTPPGGKADWIAAIPALDRIMAEAKTERLT